MPVRQLPLDIKLREDATFANYIGEAPRRIPSCGIVVMFGEPGTGKSHLLQAICHDARERGASTFYLDAPAEHEAAIVSGLEGVDVLCFDDVDAVLGEPDWEEAIFHVINAVRDSRRLLVLSTRQAPAQLDVRLPDLRSRLVAADTIETDRLGDADKKRLLKEKAARQGFELGDDVARFILSRADRSPRGLIDLLSAIEVATLAHQRKVTIPLVKSVLAS